MSYAPCERPTLHFIGVTTKHSSIMTVFPAWARHFGLDHASISGIDFAPHADPAAYREAVAYIRDDPNSLGALVTTHKIDLFEACRDMFDEIDPFAALMRETSCISKRDGKLVCHAKDPISSGLAIDGFLGPEYWKRTDGDVFAMGAGGSTIAMTWHLMRKERGANVPGRIVVSDREPGRIDEIRRVHSEIESDVPVEYVLVEQPAGNDAVLPGLAPGSLVINATGLGKDAPGSPLTEAAEFPEAAVAWELNYRGDLIFLKQARIQEVARNLTIVDGWTYFIHGWTQVIAEVFDIEIDPGQDNIDRLTEIALRAKNA
ncbi:shikimate 5-dehydrogenase [Palleronia aestuarii]|uniref:Shikimate 5-dehydrogenase n=1 Tax=Palleronia aestuarii TaxID=568105 RepID=A0A2W7N5T0_9RHOB|nr:shikimate dehydrogenase [Palleronia aestuarii]PZX12204.1 shikimate 5-dehydrogenase [Palleronia aestuarii]